MQNSGKAAQKYLNLHRRFASALADTPLKNGCCTLVLGANYNRINILMLETRTRLILPRYCLSSVHYTLLRHHPKHSFV